MKTPVLAIGLHALSPSLLETWMEQGYLNNIRRLREQGAYGRLDYRDSSDDVQRWTSFLVGRLATETGYRGRLKLRPGSYEIGERQDYNFAEFAPFYALGDDYRVVVYQTPLAQITEDIPGIQVLGNRSHPPEWFATLKSKYGKAPHYKEYSCWWERTANLKSAQKAIYASSAYHAAVCQELMQQADWDLFLAVIEEPHYAGHDFWHLSQPSHPLYAHLKRDPDASDPLRDIYEEADRVVGELVALAPDNARILLFSIDGMGNNTIDLPSMCFLPEFLYRFNFPGQVAIAPGKMGKTPPPPITNPKRQSWAGEVWQLKHDANPLRGWLRRSLPGKYQDRVDQWFNFSQQPTLASPHQMLKQAPTLGWQPTLWYKPFWHQMKASALPSFGNGFIRINLKGREPQGIVSPEEYDRLCETLTHHLHQIVDARTGQPMVEKVVRTRESAIDDDPKLPDADLIVVWKDHPTDVIDCPPFGRIGPIPFCNTGGHKPVGFVLATGEGIPSGASLPTGHLLDLPPTILDLMNAPISASYEGKSLLKSLTLTEV